MGEVWRGGETSGRVSREKASAKDGDFTRPLVLPGGAHANDQRQGIRASCRIASKGGGKTDIFLWFGSEEFEKIVACMMKADPKAAEKAFNLALGIKEKEMVVEPKAEPKTKDEYNSSNNENNTSENKVYPDDNGWFALIHEEKWKRGGGPFSRQEAQKMVEEHWKTGRLARVFHPSRKKIASDAKTGS